MIILIEEYDSYSCESPVNNKSLIRSSTPILSNKVKSHCLEIIKSILILADLPDSS
jgi:hypothetical protein